MGPGDEPPPPSLVLGRQVTVGPVEQEPLQDEPLPPPPSLVLGRQITVGPVEVPPPDGELPPPVSFFLGRRATIGPVEVPVRPGAELEAKESEADKSKVASPNNSYASQFSFLWAGDGGKVAGVAGGAKQNKAKSSKEDSDSDLDI